MSSITLIGTGNMARTIGTLADKLQRYAESGVDEAF